MKCPTCVGEKGWIEDYGLYWFSGEHIPCGHCDGTGSLGTKEWLLNWFWLNIPVEILERYIDWSYKRWLDTQEKED